VSRPWGAHRLERFQVIPRPRPAVFAFFTEAANLQRLTPPFLDFRIVTPGPIAIGAGTLIDYELRLYGVPLRWRTRIEEFEPGASFTDIQLSGPYRRWEHRHEFADHPVGTVMRDVIDYELPFGLLGAAAHPLFVRPSLLKIFDYRRRAVAQIFGVLRA
jgi:ligand-binding SRPBCC domain-containing protein